MRGAGVCGDIKRGVIWITVSGVVVCELVAEHGRVRGVVQLLSGWQVVWAAGGKRDT